MRITAGFSRSLILASLSLLLLLSACSSPADPAVPPGTALPLPAETAAVLAPTTAAPAPTLPPADTPVPGPASAALDLTGVATGVALQVVEAVASGPDAAWWAVMPQYASQTLLGYPVSDHAGEPQIFVFPLQGLEVNEAARKAAADLHALLQEQQAGEQMPFLPLSSGMQMMYAQVKYLDFQNGRGVRYLTQYANGIVPVNNHELFYTYQGLTANGQYYLAVVLPVSLDGLPVYSNETENLPLEFTTNSAAYLASIVTQLNLTPESAYAPDLSKLDAVVGSIEVR
jgi:hypothetical protein